MGPYYDTKPLMLPEYTQTLENLADALIPHGAIAPKIETILDDEADMLVFNLLEEDWNDIMSAVESFIDREKVSVYVYQRCTQRTEEGRVATAILAARF